MSGGSWGYKSNDLEELACLIEERRAVLAEIIRAAARTEHIIDWAECCDNIRRAPDGSGAERDLYDLWLGVFMRLYDGADIPLPLVPDIARKMWEILTRSNPACSCCSSDDEYRDRVNEAGALIGKTWNGL